MEKVLLYKCRNCGKIYEDSTRGDLIEMIFYSLVNFGDVKIPTPGAMTPQMISTHSCGKNITGVSDLAGLKPINP